ncbi:hypothetical protein GBAR_LOCUS28313 [Geodia barretti]|uniref:DUF2382 domain-containing protein n=1 Tax=Geodia barretti TaxID=519541 RepID=A0AA35TQ71_GEOBA|nr:hypothetical protein GBAR_LOCUS28313 [Geodia barretti]
MAVIAGEVRVAQGEGGEVVAIQDELVLKEGEHGGPARLERRERVLVAVPDEDGNVAVAEQVTVRAVEMPPPTPDPPPSQTVPIRPEPRPPRAATRAHV